MPAKGQATWRLVTPSARSGALALLQIQGDLGFALGGLGIAPVEVGGVALRSLASIDEGVVAVVTPHMAFLAPHGGLEVVRRLCMACVEAGIARGDDESVLDRFPEARSAFEAALLETLARAASPRAIDLLLAQPGVWADAGRADPGLDTPDPDAELSAARRHLLVPPLVVGIGASNIGKSTLLNAMAGRTVAIAVDHPGTTRDHVGSMLEVDGLVIRYVDTPGRRPDADGAELAALRLVDGLLPEADLVVRLGDLAHPPPEVETPGATVSVALRTDLGSPSWAADLGVCAISGKGLEDLGVLLRRRLVPDRALAPAALWRFWSSPGA